MIEPPWKLLREIRCSDSQSPRTMLRYIQDYMNTDSGLPSKFEQSLFVGRVFQMALCLSLATLVMLGCGSGATPANTGGKSTSRDSRQMQKQSNSLFRSIVSRLNRLPESCQLDLTPPSIMLDGRSSANGQDIMATITRRPGDVDGPINYLLVTSSNGRFKAAEIEPGDTIKYFAKYDRATQDRINAVGEADIVTFDSFDLFVAQVLDNNTLLIAGSLPVENLTPYKVEIWRNVDDRMKEIDYEIARYDTRRDPALNWQPTADDSEIELLVENLNQWIRQSKGTGTKSSWADPAALISTLPESIRTNKKLATLLKPEDLKKGKFQSEEGRLLQGITWQRSVSIWSRGESLEALDQACQMFDWVVRNVQLIKNSEESPHILWEVMLYGRGTAAQRAWLFAALCQQQNLPAVIVEFPQENTKPYLLVGVKTDEGLSLFDPRLGLPLPGETGKAIGADRTVATLETLKKNPAWLRSLDLDDQNFPLQEANLSEARIRLVADPFALTDRASRLDDQLGGADRHAIALRVSAYDSILTEDLEPVLWEFPFQTYVSKFTVGQNVRKQEVKRFLPYAWRPALWNGRALHFRGKRSSTQYSDSGEEMNDLRDAGRLYMSPRVRPTEKRLQASLEGSEVKLEIFSTAKAMATYWLSLIAYEQGRYKNAERWLDNAAFDSKYAKTMKLDLDYQRARLHEAQNEFDKAAEILSSDKTTPQQDGNRLRAKWLVDKGDPSESEVETAAEESGDESDEN